MTLALNAWDLVDEASARLGAQLDRRSTGRTVTHAGCHFDISSVGAMPQESLVLRVDLADFDPQRDAASVLVGMLLNTNLSGLIGLPSWYAADDERAKLCVHFAYPTHGATPSDFAQTIEKLAETFHDLELTDTES